MGRKKKETLEVAQEDINKIELAARNDFVLVHSNGVSSSDFTADNLINWLRNPIKFHPNLRKASKFYYNKNGIISQVYDIYKDLPSLNYTVMYNNQTMKKIKTYENMVNQFLENVNIRQLVRDTIFSLVMNGTVVWYKRNDKYIQILDLDYLRFSKQVNGEFIPEFDLYYLERYNILNNPYYTNYDLNVFIESLPDEITLQKYNAWKKDATQRFVPLNAENVCVFKIKSERNQALGLPLGVPAIPHILHLELLERSEKSLANRIIQQILLQKVSSPTKGKDNSKPPSPTQINFYHENLKQLIQKTEVSDSGGTAPLTIPDWVDITELKVNMTTFDKEVFNRIINQILLALGVSSSAINGAGQNANFSSANINIEKIYRDIFVLLEQIEHGLNKFLNQIVSTRNVTPKLRFSRDTLSDKKTQVDMMKDLYLQGRGNLKSWISATGSDFEAYMSQTEYENSILDLDNLQKFPIHPTSFTLRDTGDGGLTDENGNPSGVPANTGGGRPTKDATSKTDSTNKSDSQGSNNYVKPSTNK